MPLITRAHVEPWLALWREEAGSGTEWLPVPPPPFGSVAPERRHWRLAVGLLERICRERMVAGQLVS